MYNRYIPQPDGSYHRRPMQEPAPQPAAPCPPPPKDPPHGKAPGFLHRLIPKDFDTGDLLIILLLLLMSGDCAEDQNTALLTLALYCFM